MSHQFYIWLLLSLLPIWRAGQLEVARYNSPDLSTPTDSVGSKVGREAAAIAGGVVDGLFAAAHNFKDHPLDTAVEVAEGAGVAAVVGKVAILKIPAQALTVFAGMQAAEQLTEFSREALPAVAEIWSNPDASQRVKSDLQKNVADLTAAGTVSLGTMMVAGKGLSLLEKSAPNNAIGRLVFGQEPVSFKYPRHVFTAGTSGGFGSDIELKPFTQSELARLVTVQKRDYTYRGMAPGPFKSSAEAQALGQRPFTEPSRIYKIEGAKTEVVVPESLDRGIDQVRRLERALSFPHSLLNGGRNKTLRVELAAHPLAHAAKPEDILTQLATLPNSNLLKTVVLSPYPIERFRANIARPPRAGAAPVEAKETHFSGLATAATETTHLLHSAQLPVGVKAVRGMPPGTILRHEWSHFAHYGNADYKDAFDSAAFIERQGFYMRKYATTNVYENQAVHFGEGLLHPKSRPFREVSDQAPLRGAVMGRRLGQILDNVPEAERGLYHELYSSRLKRLEGQTLKRASSILGYMAESKVTAATRSGADRNNILHYLDKDAPPTFRI